MDTLVVGARYPQLSRLIRSRAAELGLSQSELRHELASRGTIVSRQAVSAWWLGTRSPSRGTLPVVLDVLALEGEPRRLMLECVG